MTPAHVAARAVKVLIDYLPKIGVPVRSEAFRVSFIAALVGSACEAGMSRPELDAEITECWDQWHATYKAPAHPRSDHS